MSLIIVAALFALAFVSTFVQRVTGFGYGIVFVSVAHYLLATHGETTALSGMLAIVCAFTTAIKFRKHLVWRRMIYILITFLVVSFVGVRLVAVTDTALMRKILGIALIGVSLYFLFLNGRIKMRASAAVQVSMGTCSGLMGGMFGMQGPPAVLYFISCAGSKEEYMALTQWYFIIGNLFMTFYRAGSGFVTTDVLHMFACCVPAVLLGLWVGGKVYDRMPINLLRKTVYVFIGVAGVCAIIF